VLKSTALTPLGMSALALLAERPMHPYEMYQLLIARKEDRLLKIRPGTLYHALGRLEEHGLVQVTGTERQGNRPERTSYRITDSGSAALRDGVRELLAAAEPEYPAFPLAVSQAHNLPADVVVEALDQRLAGLRERLTELQASERAVRAKALPAKIWVDLDFQQTMLGAEIAWMENFSERISTGGIDW
jgi:DNA-binding PadR family transcriptional regulator